MPASKRTAHYDLPLYLPQDKTSWLADFNGAMKQIDNALYQFSQGRGGEDQPILKTINGQSLVGTTNIEVQNVLTDTGNNANIKTINNQSILGPGNLSITGNLPNFKTINEEDIIGDGNIAVQSPLISGESIKTINGQSILGEGNLEIQSGSGNSVKIQPYNDLIFSSNELIHLGEWAPNPSGQYLFIFKAEAYTTDVNSKHIYIGNDSTQFYYSVPGNFERTQLTCIYQSSLINPSVQFKQYQSGNSHTMVLTNIYVYAIKI